MPELNSKVQFSNSVSPAFGFATVSGNVNMKPSFTMAACVGSASIAAHFYDKSITKRFSGSAVGQATTSEKVYFRNTSE